MAYVDDTGGTFIGDIGFGGVTPTTVIHAEHNRADKLVFFKNTSSSGAGLRIQNGTDSNYGLKISSAAGTDTIQLFGSGLVQIGANATVLSAVQAWRPYTVISAPSGNDIKDTGLVFAANLGSDALAYSMIQISGNDRGFRILYNAGPGTSGTGPAAYDSTLAQMSIFFEQDGVISLNYARPSSLSASTWDNLSGKSLCFGNADANGRVAKYARIHGGQLGRGLDLGVADTSTNVCATKIRMEGDGASNPVSIYVAGALQNVTAGANDSGGSGYRLLRVPN